MQYLRNCSCQEIEGNETVFQVTSELRSVCSFVISEGVLAVCGSYCISL